MSYEEEIQVYKGNLFLSKLYGNKKTPVVIAFDLDETLGSFSDLETLWTALLSFEKPTLSVDFNKLLDLYPEFIRYGILPILEFLYQKKKKGICDKIYIYTNNQCSPEWCKMIARYFDYKLNQNSEPELFDKIICAFKINNKIVELGRTTHHKTYNDFIKCTVLPKKTRICFIDNTYFQDMTDERVYYIQPRSYNHHLNTDVIIDRFMGSGLCSILVDSAKHYLLADYLYKRFYKKGFVNNGLVSKELLESDVHVAQKMMYHIKEFFYLTQKKNRTKKIKYPIGRFTKKKRT